VEYGKAVKNGGQVDEMDNIQKLTYNYNKFATKKKTIRGQIPLMPSVYITIVRRS
jgi:hypothetical protein